MFLCEIDIITILVFGPTFKRVCTCDAVSVIVNTLSVASSLDFLSVVTFSYLDFLSTCLWSVRSITEWIQRVSKRRIYVYR